MYTTEWVAAQDQVAAWCADAGLAVRRDAVGNVWGKLDGRKQTGAIVTGSHIDTQIPGGQFDGALGVVAALIALRELKEQFGTPRRPIELVSLCEEEATRFQANFWGSRAITGQITPGETDAICDSSNISIGDAMRSVGLDPNAVAGATRNDIEAFLELHIEQGPILEEADLPVGIVDRITGSRMYLVEIGGRADHAGARPMRSRLDAMAGSVEIISNVLDRALQMGAPAVTTVGRIHVAPNLPAVVPESVVFTIDARHPDPDALARLYDGHESAIKSIAARRGLTAKYHVLFDQPPCPCDVGLITVLEHAARRAGIQYQKMHSGAAHDSQQMAKITRVAMIFVRSAGGRSHTPAEFTESIDAEAGIKVLIEALHELAY